MRRGRGERGAESLEFLGALPLLMLVMLLAWQGIVLARERAEAETDARTIARAAVLCPAVPPPALGAVDPGARGTTALSHEGDAARVVVAVSLEPVSVLPDVDLSHAGLGPVTASVTMEQEPCG